MLRNDGIYSLESLNLNILDEVWTDDECGMPTLDSCDFVPSRLLPFNKIRTTHTKNWGVHFYIEDYQFERVWNSPDRYVSNLAKYDCVLSPDYSIYLDLPKPLKYYQIYRNRFIAQWWQRSGINVIYNVPVVESNLYNAVFNGIEGGGTIAIRTPLDYKRNPYGQYLFFAILNEIKNRLNPSTLIVYSSELLNLPKDLTIKQFQNENITRFRQIK